ncbi:MAG: tetratricopeptide repeat protein [Fimbriimonadales bacterium]
MKLFKQVDECVRKGRLDRAIQMLHQVLETGKQPLECYVRLAELYRRKHNWQNAIGAIRNALLLNPESDTLRKQMVEMLIESGDFASAEQECRMWLALEPNHPTPLELLLEVYTTQMDYGRALPIAERLVRLQPLSHHYRFRRARLLKAVGRLHQAIDDYEQLAFDESVPFELVLLSRMELESLDYHQMDTLFHLLMEDKLFRLKFLHDPVPSARERGFHFSRVGEAMLEQVPEALRELPKFPRHNGSYH